MDQQNQNKTNRFILNNTELHSDFRVHKIRKSQSYRLSINKLGLGHLVEHEMNKENKQPLAIEAKKELKKKIDLQKKRPTFKVSIPHHKYWSPTAKDTPISHFHGFNKGHKARPALSRRISQVAAKKLDKERQSVARTETVDSFIKNSPSEIIKEEVLQEILKEENVVDELEEKHANIEENNTSDLDLLNLDDSEYQVKILDVMLLPVAIIMVSMILRFIFKIYSLFSYWLF